MSLFGSNAGKNLLDVGCSCTAALRALVYNVFFISLFLVLIFANLLWKYFKQKSSVAEGSKCLKGEPEVELSMHVDLTNSL